MGKRPSLAETMRQVAVPPTLQPPAAPAKLAVVPDPVEPAQSAEPQTPAARAYFAATRVGKKKVTAALSPAAHKQLKSLAIENDATSETLLSEAIRDLFTKYGKAAID